MRIAASMCAAAACGLLCATAWTGAADALAAQKQAPASEWILDNLTTIGGYPVTVAGSPRSVETPVGTAVEFDGVADALLVNVNPIQGQRQFTIEALVEPAAGGPEEQRFLHIQEAATDSRALLELRLSPDAAWCLDTFLKQGTKALTLIDRSARHPAAAWHAVALTYDGATMAHYVDGRREGAGAIVFGPLGEGRTSIGVRQNRVSWFKGRIRMIRFTPAALPADRLMVVPGAR